MADATLRLYTAGRSGPIRFKVQFVPRSEGDFLFLVGRERTTSIEESIWSFKNKENMVIFPKKAFNENLRTAAEKRKGDPDLNVWQPSSIFITILSNSGCVIDFTAVFVAEE